MITLISTYGGLEYDLGDTAKKLLGTFWEKSKIDTKEKINDAQKYWLSDHYKMTWKLTRGRLWQIIRRKSSEKPAPQVITN